MKSILALSLLLTSVCLAGTPDQDPSLLQIKADFTKAVPLKMADLKINHTYQCFMFQAWKGAYGIYVSDVTFTQIDGMTLLIEHQQYVASNEVKVVSETEKGLEAKTAGDPRDNVVIRKSVDGGVLFIEQSSAQAKDGEVKAVAYPKNTLENYEVCSEK